MLRQAFLHAADLRRHAGAGRFQSLGLAVEVFADQAGIGRNVVGGRHHVGGADGQGGFGFAQLCLRQVRGVGNHARLAIDGFDNAAGLFAERLAHQAHGFAFVFERARDALSGGARDLGGVLQAVGFALQLGRQFGDVGVGQAYGAYGVIDLGAQGIDEFGRLHSG